MSSKWYSPTYWIRKLLFLVLVIAILSSFTQVLSRVILPEANEYDDPSTAAQESFPWNPNIFTNFTGAMKLLGMGALRHVSLMSGHVNSQILIVLVGYLFVTIFIYRVRKTFQAWEKGEQELGVRQYMEWAIGSILGAIIYLSGLVLTDIASITSGIFWLSIAAIIIYLIHPDWGGLSPAIKSKIYPRIPCPHCKHEIPSDSKYCPECGKRLR